MTTEKKTERPALLTYEQVQRLVKKYFVHRSIADLESYRRHDGMYPAYAVNQIVKSEKERAASAKRREEHKATLERKFEKIVKVLKTFLKQDDYTDQGYATESRQGSTALLVTRNGRVVAVFRRAGKHTCQRSHLRFAMLAYSGFREDGLLTQDDFI